MVNMTKLQLQILEDLFQRDVLGQSIELTSDRYELTESDDIMKIRQLVYNIDALIALGMIDAKDKYYYESDFVSFEYMNKAVEIREDRLNISKLGINFMQLKHQKGLMRRYNLVKVWLNSRFHDKPYMYLMTHLFAVIIGMALMWGIMQLV